MGAIVSIGKPSRNRQAQLASFVSVRLLATSVITAIIVITRPSMPSAHDFTLPTLSAPVQGLLVVGVIELDCSRRLALDTSPRRGCAACKEWVIQLKQKQNNKLLLLLLRLLLAAPNFTTCHRQTDTRHGHLRDQAPGSTPLAPLGRAPHRRHH